MKGYIVHVVLIFSCILCPVTLSGGTFKGFLCQARTDAADANTKVGTLTATGSVIMNQNCGAVSNIVISSYVTCR